MFNRRWHITDKQMHRVVAMLLASLLLISPVGADQASLLSGKELVAALRTGGLNIYFRHVATVWSQSDELQQQDDWLSCDPMRMRQLSDAGRADAIAIGAISKSTEVMNLRASEYFGGSAAVVASARKLLASKPRSGGNRVIVAHGNVARAATPYYPAEGEGLIFKPDGDSSFILVGRIEPQQWAELLTLADE